MVHRFFKGLVPHTNRKNLELDLVRRYNTLQALRFIVDGGEDSRFPGRRSHIAEIILDNCVSQLLSGWYAMDIDSINNDIGKENGELSIIIIMHFISFQVFVSNVYFQIGETISHLSCFVDIVLRQKWDKSQIRNAGFSNKLEVGNPIYHDLVRSYSVDLLMDAALVNKKIEFYNYIAYKVVEDDNTSKMVKLHVGDIVSMNEEIEQVAFARIKAILRHRANNTKYYAFLVFDWFEAIAGEDNVLRCPCYNLQKRGETQWRQLFPITIVDNMPDNHFIHACTSTCKNSRDLTYNVI